MGLGECMRLKSHANIGNFCIYNLLMTSGFFFDHLISIEIKVMKESRDVIEDYTQISYIHTHCPFNNSTCSEFLFYYY